MKEQILIGLILLSSVVKMHAQTNADLLDGQHGSFYGEFNSLTLASNIDYNAVSYNRNSNLIIQPIHLPNYTGQTNAPFQDYGMIATIGGLSMFPTQLAFSNGGKIAYRTSYKYSDSYTFDNAWRNIVTVGVGSAQNHLTKFGPNNDITNSIIYDDGTKVGIGTGTPNDYYMLDVAGKARVTDEFTVSGSGTDIGGKINILNIAKTGNGQASKWTIFNMAGNYGNSLQFWAYDNIGCSAGGTCASRLTLMDKGYVGIGTINPQSRLQLGDTNDGTNKTFKIPGTYNFEQLNLNMGANGNGELEFVTHFGVTNSGGVKLYNTDGANLCFQTAGSTNSYGALDYQTKMILTNSGYVGIGTTTPDEALTVKGRIHTNEVIIDMKAPIADYVFHPNYKLMPLTQVEQYVKTNSHLPEIPSASEVAKNGMSMGEMQNKLLQKVEELTLYVIDLQKTNEQQSAEINQLKQQLRK